MADGIAVMKLIRNPLGISVIVAASLTVVFWLDRTQNHASSPLGEIRGNSDKSPASISPSTVTASPGGGELPEIVKRFGRASPSSENSSAPAPGLENLLAGLEAKVKANPANVSNRILLAQTYLELGFSEKALHEARQVVETQPSLPRAKLVLASILSKSQQQKELKEAISLLESLRTQTEVKPFLVQLYLGDASIRLGDHQGAIKYWKAALTTMPAMDNRREDLQKRVKEIEGNA